MIRLTNESEPTSSADPANRRGRSLPETSRYEIVNPLRHADWDAQVHTHASSTFFHGSAWARVLTQSFGFTPHYVADIQSEQMKLLVPLMEVSTWMHRRAVGLPFTDECQPLTSEPVTANSIWHLLKPHARARGWQSIEIRGAAALNGESPASVAYWAHTLDLRHGEENVFRNLDSSVRRAIRKAEKCGVMIRIERSSDAMKQFYNLYCLTRKRHGLPPQSFRFFANIQREILDSKLGFISEAIHCGRPIAASVFFVAGKKAIYKYGASDMAWQAFRGSTLVMWEAIRWLISQGVALLHLGRTSSANEGLRRFKLNWGCEESALHYLRYNVCRERTVTLPDRAQGWYNLCFRVMPLPVARLAGRALYRYAA